MNVIVFDTETTGLPLHPGVNLQLQPKIIEFGAALLDSGGNVIEKYNQLINPGQQISAEITKITGITNEDLVGQPLFEAVLPEISAFFQQGSVLVAHNLPFDKSLLEFELQRLGCPEFPWPKTQICTVEENREKYGFRPKLIQLYKDVVGKELHQTHRAIDDVLALVDIWVKGGFHAAVIENSFRM